MLVRGRRWRAAGVSVSSLRSMEGGGLVLVFIVFVVFFIVVFVVYVVFQYFNLLCFNFNINLLCVILMLAQAKCLL